MELRFQLYLHRNNIEFGIPGLKWSLGPGLEQDQIDNVLQFILIGNQRWGKAADTKTHFETEHYTLKVEVLADGTAGNGVHR